MSLSKEQLTILTKADKTGKLPIPIPFDVCPGIHWCPDWDFQPICNDSPEKSGCCCEPRSK